MQQTKPIAKSRKGTERSIELCPADKVSELTDAWSASVVKFSYRPTKRSKLLQVRVIRSRNIWLHEITILSALRLKSYTKTTKAKTHSGHV